MEFLLNVVLALFLAKILGGLSRRAGFVELLGAILAGIILGPVLGVIEPTTIEPLGKLGLIMILFLAGLNIAPKTILREGRNVVLIGLMGGLLPFLLSLLLIPLIGLEAALVLGTIASATSVSVSAGTLIQEGKINTRVGRLVLFSSVVDDVVGLVLLLFLVVVLSGSLEATAFLKLIADIILFTITLYVLFMYLPPVFRKLLDLKMDEGEVSLAITMVLFLAILAELFGFSSIIGAFAAGLILGRVKNLKTRLFLEKFEAISDGFLVPLFFVWVGSIIHPDLSSFLSPVVWLFVAIALLGKVLAALMIRGPARLSLTESLALGVARMPRGEVALSVLMTVSAYISGPIISNSALVMLFVSILLTPLILRPLLRLI